MNLTTNRGVSHDREEETIEAKARWFQSLSLKERMELFCALTDLILAVNPKIVEQRDAQPVRGRVRVLSMKRSESNVRRSEEQI
jgi:hypothetical protein